MSGIVAAIPLTLALASTPAASQTASAPQGGPPPAASWTPARTPDGQPDIQGSWAFDPAVNPALGGYSLEWGESDVQRMFQNRSDGPRLGRSLVIDPPDGRVPYLPAALAKRNLREKHYQDPPSIEFVDTNERCYPNGILRLATRGAPQIFQFPGVVLMLWEFAHQYRTIYLDGRPRAAENIKLWRGDSRGRWEGNTLVVETTNINGFAWIDHVGNFITDRTHIVERFTLLDGKTLDWQATMTDPSIYSRPWTMGFKYLRDTDAQDDELLEHACYEGNKFMQHLTFPGK